MPAITVNTFGQADTDMKEMVAIRTGIAPPASNVQVTAYWRTAIANDLKWYLQDKARVAAGSAITDPNVT